MVCAEAQAVAKPVVGFDSGGISEVVSHARTGFLAAEGDWQALGEYLFVLLQDAKLRERFGLSGRESVLRQFDLEHRTRVLEGIYARVSGSNASRRNVNYGPILQSTPIRSSHPGPAL
jgi:glycosyltransferase involved in cell wall biosynthesis